VLYYLHWSHVVYIDMGASGGRGGGSPLLGGSWGVSPEKSFLAVFCHLFLECFSAHGFRQWFSNLGLRN
jgi:hypothetical protein